MLPRSLAVAPAVALVSIMLAPPAVALEKQKVGVAASIENDVEGVLENSIEKLGEGSEVFFKQLVRTGEASKANLRFLDDTNLDVWPKTEIRLDSFVYQPGKKSGSVVLNVPLGYVRFVTGALSPKSYTINTPLGFIGIRGTEFDLVVKSDRLTARLLKGEIRITALDRRVFWLRTPNAAITIHRDGRVNGPRNWTGDVVEFADLAPPARRAAVPAAPPARAARATTNAGQAGFRPASAAAGTEGTERNVAVTDRPPRTSGSSDPRGTARSATGLRDSSQRSVSQNAGSTGRAVQSSGPQPGAAGPTWRSEQRAIITRPGPDRPR